MKALQKRSSWASSFLTGIIGWVGWLFIGALALGYSGSSLTLFLLALGLAFVQVLLLRLLFFPLQMHRHLLVGAFWGGITAAAFYYLTRSHFPFLAESPVGWLVIYLYIGVPVGGFLSYFYRDDQKIMAEAAANPDKIEIDYGRDAHWLEPFGYGALAYLLAFMPGSFNLAVYVFIVGAISGVAAAGVSHFSPDRWKFRLLPLLLLILAQGGLQGLLTGLLFRQFQEDLYAHHLLLGSLGGVLTYLATLLRGRQLAKRERFDILNF